MLHPKTSPGPRQQGCTGPEQFFTSRTSVLILQFSSVRSLTHVQLFAILWTGFPVHHQLPELAQTHVHCVGDAIQPSHPLLSPSPPLSIFPNIRVFSKESVLRFRWSKYCSFSFNISPSKEYSGLIPLGFTDQISLQSKGLSRGLSNTTVQKHQFFHAQLFLYNPALTSIHDYWKNHSFD